MKWLLTLLVLLLSVPAYGEIEMLDSVNVGDKLTATVKAQIPPGASFNGGWQITCTDGAACRASFAPMQQADTIGIWAPAGTYQVTFSGYWLIIDFDARTYQTGNVYEVKSVVVGTPVPPPPPPASRAVIVEESEQRTAAQAALWGQVRKAYQQKLPIVDESSPGTYSAIVQAARAKSSPLPLPALVLLDTAGGVVAVEKCPDTLQGLQQRIGG